LEHPRTQLIFDWKITVKWMVDHKISASFALATLMLIVIGVVAYDDITSLVRSAGWVTHTQKVVGELEQVLSKTQAIQSGCRGYFLSGDGSDLQNYIKSQLDLPEDFDALKATTRDNPVQSQGLAVLELLVSREVYLSRQMVQARRERGAKAPIAQSLGAQRDTMEAIRRQIQEMQDHENRLLATRNQQEQISAGNAKLTIALGTVTAVVILCFTLYVLNLETQERMYTQAKLERANAITSDHARRLETVNKELEAFSYSVSHDLRAPLRHINGFIRLLREKYGNLLDAEGRRYITTIMDASTRMGQLIDDLLAFSRVGRVALKKNSIDVANLVNEIVEGEKEALNERVVSWDIQPLLAITGDSAMVRQVFVNLISNALKYTRSRPKAEIKIGSMRQGDDVCYYVSDNGVGFDMEHADKLFGVFQRLHRDEDFEGTGIGLANVQRIVNRHGGKAWAQAAVDKGATFYFTLPRTRQEAVRKQGSGTV
jgi:signal transduction histidine kinase